jgi:succinate dehydrogenase hydrophobic anchor subunit
MMLLRERSRRSAWDDWKKDNWLAQAAFGLFLALLAVWLIVLYRGAPLAF